MPIYAYKCDSCGHAKDVLQKMSDATLTRCPQCGADTFKKQLTAAGFQLKGSGWYVTDFKGGSNAAPPAGAADAAAPAEGAKPSEAGAASAAPSTVPASGSAVPAMAPPPPAPAPAPGPSSTGKDKA